MAKIFWSILMSILVITLVVIISWMVFDYLAYTNNWGEKVTLSKLEQVPGSGLYLMGAVTIVAERIPCAHFSDQWNSYRVCARGNERIPGTEYFLSEMTLYDLDSDKPQVSSATLVKPFSFVTTIKRSITRIQAALGLKVVPDYR